MIAINQSTMALIVSMRKSRIAARIDSSQDVGTVRVSTRFHQ